jgi:thioesterase domain-containing protein
LYCIHPAGGSIIRYQAFADSMTGFRAVYGLQSRTLLDSSYVRSSIDEIARDYVELIRRNQPQGPYLLLGWSMGGHIAVKMTEVIEQSGEEVAFLGLLDTKFATRKPKTIEARSRHESAAYYHLVHFASIEGIEIEDRLSASDREHLSEISSQLDERELFVYTAMWGQERGFWTNISAELMNFIYIENQMTSEIMRSFVLKRVRAPIHIWWCHESIDQSGGIPCDWQEFTSGAVHSEIVGGDHETIVRDPLVHAKISRVLGNLHMRGRSE